MMLKKISWFNFIALAFLLVAPQNAIADITNPQITFKPTAEDRKPKKTALGGRRTNDKKCLQDTEPNSSQTGLTALVPLNGTGSTTSTHPTFWIYLPETTATKILLSVMEESPNGAIKHHGQTVFQIPPQSGLISLKLPDQSSPLEIGKNYKWAVILVCGKNLHPNDPVIEARINRIQASIPNQPENPIKKAIWFGQQGIWYDFLESFAQAKQANPNDQAVKTDWQNMLKSLDLVTLDSNNF
jgi:hypothetical protein